MFGWYWPEYRRKRAFCWKFAFAKLCPFVTDGFKTKAPSKITSLLERAIFSQKCASFPCQANPPNRSNQRWHKHYRGFAGMSGGNAHYRHLSGAEKSPIGFCFLDLSCVQIFWHPRKQETSALDLKYFLCLASPPFLPSLQPRIFYQDLEGISVGSKPLSGMSPLQNSFHSLFPLSPRPRANSRALSNGRKSLRVDAIAPVPSQSPQVVHPLLAYA